MCKYGIFVAKIYKYAPIDSFQGFSGSLDSAANCAALGFWEMHRLAYRAWLPSKWMTLDFLVVRNTLQNSGEQSKTCRLFWLSNQLHSPSRSLQTTSLAMWQQSILARMDGKTTTSYVSQLSGPLMPKCPNSLKAHESLHPRPLRFCFFPCLVILFVGDHTHFTGGAHPCPQTCFRFFISVNARFALGLLPFWEMIHFFHDIICHLALVWLFYLWIHALLRAIRGNETLQTKDHFQH